ncbi:hypothetical protein [Paucibacter soli]|uniref:hypothetical protein n=1 Tax=Paucibacter soli TaxID=3133433 RepID=UPI003094ABDC
MQPMPIPRARWLAPALLTLALGQGAAIAATINSVFTPLGGNSWTADFTVLGDGTPASLSGFTVFFAETDFSNLQVLGSPASWDSLVAQPDTGIPAAGFFDSVMLNRALGLGAGQSQGGFVVKFDYLGATAPGSLHYEITDENFQLLASGQTTLVPEPAGWAQLCGGLGLLGLLMRRRGAGSRS